MRHHAIIVTAWDKKRLEKAHIKATELFEGNVSNLTPIMINGYCSFFIPPDGSKAGWDEDILGDKNREVFKAWLIKHEDILCVKWIEVLYGDDNGKAEIISYNE